MFVAAYLAICGLVYLTVYEPGIGQYGQGVVTMVLGMFLNELKNMYGYETGATRGGATKDAALTRIAEQAAPATAAAVAASTAATVAAATPGTPIPLVPVKPPDIAAQPTEVKP